METNWKVVGKKQLATPINSNGNDTPSWRSPASGGGYHQMAGRDKKDCLYDNQFRRKHASAKRTYFSSPSKSTDYPVAPCGADANTGNNNNNIFNNHYNPPVENIYTPEALYKTEMCESFETTGQCRYGTKCRFAHGQSQLRPRPQPQKYKTEKCVNFPNCKYGRRCRFIHDEKDAELEHMRLRTASTTPERSYPARKDHGNIYGKEEESESYFEPSTLGSPRPHTSHLSPCPSKEKMQAQSNREHFLVMKSMAEDLLKALDRVTLSEEEEEEEEEEKKPQNAHAHASPGHDNPLSEPEVSHQEYVNHLRRLDIFEALTTPEKPAIASPMPTLLFNPLGSGTDLYDPHYFLKDALFK